MEIMKVVQFMHKNLCADEYAIWVMTIWDLWHHLCEAKHANGSLLPTFSIDRGEHYLAVFRDARQRVEVISRLQELAGERTWSLPPNGCFRVDVDALFNPNTKEYGVGMVIWNHFGVMIAARAKPIKHPKTVLGAELLAALHGIILSFERNASPIILFSDSILAVQAMNDFEDEESILDDELKEILIRASETFIVKISHIYRSANLVAHSLAQFAASLSDVVTWVSDFPPWLQHLADSISSNLV